MELAILLPLLGGATEYFVKWRGDNRSICHPMWPCDWTVAVPLFKREDIIQFTDPYINTTEQLEIFSNITAYALSLGGGIASPHCIIDGSLFNNRSTRDYFLEVSPFNESLLYGFHFTNFTLPIISVRGMELFFVINCSFTSNSASFDFPILSFSNVTVIMENVSISDNIVEGTSLIGLYTSILVIFHSLIAANTQLSRGSIPLIEMTNGASEITNSTFIDNVSPNSPIIGSWFYVIVIITNTTVSENFCGSSAFIVGDSLANVTVSNSIITNNHCALLHSMTMSTLNISASNYSGNSASGQAIIFAPRSSIRFSNGTIFNSNVAESILSSQLSNATQLNMIESTLEENICTDTAFALQSSSSRIESTRIRGNTVSSLLSMRETNFSVSGAKFEANWANGEVIRIEESSLDVKGSEFVRNFGRKSGVFDVKIENNDTFDFVFEDSEFDSNLGDDFNSVRFEGKAGKVRFEYCNFSKLRFDEVSGDLNSGEVFHRCRFEGRGHNLVEYGKGEGRNAKPFIAIFCLYVITVIVAVILFGSNFLRSRGSETPEV